jgi:catechol 2,3-dioxygenase
MTTQEPQTISTPTSIDPATQVGVVALAVADLDRSLTYYTDGMGFELLSRDGTNAVLGAGDAPLLLLHEQPGAEAVPLNTTGLYHFATLVPTRADLGRWLRHWLDAGYEMPGQGDHLVSEALYLNDPDGNGIEIYADRPRESWQWENGQVRMGTGPVDIRSLIAEGDSAALPWTGLPAGTRLGHVHLKVGSIPDAANFYGALFGFDTVVTMPTALFVSAGGYHHHLGLNTWHSRGASPAPATAAGLRFYTVEFPSDEARSAVLDRLAAASHPVVTTGDIVSVNDPWQNTILLHVGPIAGDATALNLLSRLP